MAGYGRNAALVARLLAGALLVLAGLDLGAVLLIAALLPSGNDGMSLTGSVPFAAPALWAALAGFATLYVAKKAIRARTVWMLLANPRRGTGSGLPWLVVSEKQCSNTVSHSRPLRQSAEAELAKNIRMVGRIRPVPPGVAPFVALAALLVASRF